MQNAVARTSIGPTLREITTFGEAVSEIVRLSPMVIALRTDVALNALADPLALPTAETFRMVAEKIDAVAQSAVAATLETGLAVTRSMTEYRMPFDAGFAVANAALAPFRDRLRVNVRRLGSDLDADALRAAE